MPKKPGTMLREYTEKYFSHLQALSAELTVFDGSLPENKYSQVHYSVAIAWDDFDLLIEASKDNALRVAALRLPPKETYANSFRVTGYYVIKDTLRAVWDSLQYAAYTAGVDIETIYNDIAAAAQKALQD